MNTFKLFLLGLLFFSLNLQAQKRNKSKAEPQTTISDSMFHNLKFRNIGPFRGGRSVASTGVVGQPHTFYIHYYPNLYLRWWETLEPGQNRQPGESEILGDHYVRYSSS